MTFENHGYVIGLLYCRIWYGKQSVNQRRCLQLWNPLAGDVHSEKVNDATNLNQFAKRILVEGVPLEEIVHGFIEREESEVASTSNNNCAQSKGGNTHECLFLIISIGIKCSEESPNYRMNINEALRELLAVKKMKLQS
ncbi:hypothetical protein TIFTF001_028144 [Ficus carica]|uniref:Uncharacterized protein n=1 Tax=Ficus carica TaxID=3494 RepID=A0AA88DPD6_FICCA|nr:hypothetical protein TIFTF001_028144 [Ficus carica]